MPFPTRSILVACDLSRSAEGVLNAAGALSALTDAELHVVYAMEPDTGGDAGSVPGEGSGAPERLLRDQLRRALPGTADAISARVLPGPAHEVILSRAEEVSANLVVIGPHREELETARELGSTADRIVRTSDVPCLIVRDQLSLPLRRVLVPSDLSDASSGALDVALVWAAALRVPTGGGGGTRVELLHVLVSGSAADDDANGEDERRAGAEKALRAQLAAAAERVGITAALQLESRVVEAADAAAEIMRCARHERMDLLVLGTHGMTERGRAEIGSVSSAVAREAARPVLLVPPGVWQTRQAREAQLRGTPRPDHPAS